MNDEWEGPHMNDEWEGPHMNHEWEGPHMNDEWEGPHMDDKLWDCMHDSCRMTVDSSHSLPSHGVRGAVHVGPLYLYL
jgi:hypothetical protein